jgi:amyloid beta precursor protein binding protein 1
MHSNVSLPTLPLEPEFFTRFNLIIASNLPENQLLALGKLCSERSINIISLRSYGLIGSIRLQLPGHSIIESKRDRAFPDLRISAPFPELNEYFHKYYGGNWNDLSSEQHSHIPYVVILHFALEEFRRQVRKCIFNVLDLNSFLLLPHPPLIE